MEDGAGVTRALRLPLRPQRDGPLRLRSRPTPDLRRPWAPWVTLGCLHSYLGRRCLPLGGGDPAHAGFRLRFPAMRPQDRVVFPESIGRSGRLLGFHRGCGWLLLGCFSSLFLDFWPMGSIRAQDSFSAFHTGLQPQCFPVARSLPQPRSWLRASPRLQVQIRRP